MKETNRTIANRLKRAIEPMAPNDFSNLLHLLEEEGEYKKMTNIQSADTQRTTIMPYSRKLSSIKNRKVFSKLIAVAAAFVIMLGSYSGLMYFMPQSVIGFDVNPSVEFTINRGDKVIKVSALNEEGKEVIGDMKLKNVNLDIAVNAFVGSMVRKGYLDNAKNSILVTVESKNAEKGKQLREHLADEINSLLEGYNFQGNILSQTTEADSRVRELSRKYGISHGKVCLLEYLVKKYPHLNFEEAVGLSISEINELLELKANENDQTSESPNGNLVRGRVGKGHHDENPKRPDNSSQSYIGTAKALDIALTHAKATKDQINKLEIELERDNGIMIYDIEFYIGNTEYEYDIDALSGKILEFEKKDKSWQNSDTKTESPDRTTYTDNSSQNYIGGDKALDIALKHAKATKDQIIKLEIELERENGIMIYDIEFYIGNTEYEYEIDAISGKILEGAN